MWLARWLPVLLLLAACTPDHAAEPDALPDIAVADTGHVDVRHDVHHDASMLDSDVIPADVGDASDATPTDTSCPISGQFGCPCVTDSDCDAGYCVDGEKSKICTQNCEDSCPPDWVCKQAPGADQSWICMPAFPVQCMPCKTNEDCAATFGSLCVPFVRIDTGQGHGFVDGSFCLAACTPDPSGGKGSCPSGNHCAATKVTYKKSIDLCMPDSADCTCWATWAQAGKSTSCFKSSVAGICESKRQCGFSATGQPVLSVCDAKEPTVEVCGDNVDNNCDGLTDETGAQGCIGSPCLCP